MKSKQINKLLVLILVINIILLILGILTNKNIYDEEVNSWNITKFSNHDLILGKYYDISFHPFLYFLILKYWENISIDPKWLRTLSVIFSTGSIIIFYLIAHNFFKNKRITYICSWTYLVSAYRLYWSQQVRQYPLVIFFSLLYLLTFLYAWKKGKYWILLSFISVIGLLIDYSFFWIYFIINSYLFILFFKKSRTKVSIIKKWFFSTITTIVILSFFITKFIYATIHNPQYSLFNRHLPIPSLSYLLSIISLFLINKIEISPISLLYIVIIIIGTHQLIRSKYSLILMITYLPILLSFIFSISVAPIFIDYQIMIASLGFYFILGFFIGSRKRLFLVSILLGLYTFINLMEYKNYVFSSDKEDYRGAIHYLNSPDHNNEIFFLPQYSEMSYRYFSELYNVPIIKYSNIKIPSTKVLENITNKKQIGQTLKRFCFIVTYNGRGVNSEVIKKLEDKQKFQTLALKGISIYCTN